MEMGVDANIILLNEKHDWKLFRKCKSTGLGRGFSYQNAIDSVSKLVWI